MPLFIKGLMGSPTFFGNSGNSSSSGGPADYVKDVFDDVTLQATNNSGLTSNANTNPLSGNFNDSNAVNFKAKTLYVKDIVLIQDRSQWVNNRPTYEVVFRETIPGIKAYVFGNSKVSYEWAGGLVKTQGGSQQPEITLLDTTAGFGITGTMRKVAFLVYPIDGPTGTAQIVTDGVNGTTIDYSGYPLAASGNAFTPPYSQFQHANTIENAGLHDYRIIPTTNVIILIGVTVYYENTGGNITVRPGTTYINKEKTANTLSATFSIAAMGSSLGGIVNMIESAAGYSLGPFSSTSIISIGQGSSGGNLITVPTGLGGSFIPGMGVIVPQGSSMYVGSVLSVSTDTLTVSPTLGFGLSNTIYSSWIAGSTYGINASLFSIKERISFSNANLFSLGVSQTILSLANNYSFYGQNIGLTSMNAVGIGSIGGNSIGFGMNFLGGSGSVQIDGNFQAAEIEWIGAGILHATIGVNGTPGWSSNTGFTGAMKQTIFTNGGNGWNSFSISGGASLSPSLSISSINLYKRSRDQSITFGLLATIDVNQAVTERTSYGNSMMALGFNKRVYADQMYFKGNWTRGLTTSSPAGSFFYGTSTNSVLQVQYYGRQFCLVGTAGGGTLSIDGTGVALTNFNKVVDPGSEDWHKLLYTSGSAATSIIKCVDFASAYGELVNNQNVLRETTASNRTINQITVGGQRGVGSSSFIRTFTSASLQIGGAISYMSDTAFGDKFLINEAGNYSINYVDSFASSANFCITRNQVNTGVSPSNAAVLGSGQILGTSTAGTEPINVSWTGYLNSGDLIRAAVSNTAIAGATLWTQFTISKTSTLPEGVF